MKNSWFKYIFILFAIGIFIFAFAKIRGDEEAKRKEELNSYNSQEEKIKEITLGVSNFDTINPILSNNQYVQDISRLLFEPLVNLSNDYMLQLI